MMLVSALTHSVPGSAALHVHVSPKQPSPTFLLCHGFSLLFLATSPRLCITPPPRCSSARPAPEAHAPCLLHHCCASRHRHAAVQGNVHLKEPDVKVWLIIVDTASADVGLPPMPKRYVLARELAQGAGARALVQRYMLPNRRYLGPTSMVRTM